MCVHAHTCAHVFVFWESISEEDGCSEAWWMGTFHQVKKQAGDILGRDARVWQGIGAPKCSVLAGGMNEWRGTLALSGSWVCWGLGSADHGQSLMVLSRSTSA